MPWLDLLRGAALLCAALPLAACGGGDASPGTGSGNGSTSGSGPTTFATFSTTAPMTTMPATLTVGDDTTTDDSDSNESSGTTEASEGSSSTTDDPTICPDTHMCMPEAPRDWNGPAVLTEYPIDDPSAKPEPPPECADAYPMRDGTGFTDLQAEPATCGCECAPSIASACEGSTTLRYWNDDATCDEGIAQATNVFAGACNTLPDDFPGNGFYSADPVQAVGGACQPSSTESLEPAVWGSQVSLCGGAELLDQGCADGRVCAPLPEDGQLCVWREGEHACPEGFEVPRAMFAEIDDDRGCATCSCGAPEGICDSAEVRLWNGQTCLVPGAGSIPANAECHDSGSAQVARTASLTQGQPTAFCSPSDPAPEGEAVGAEGTTICCLE